MEIKEVHNRDAMLTASFVMFGLCRNDVAIDLAIDSAHNNRGLGFNQFIAELIPYSDLINQIVDFIWDNYAIDSDCGPIGVFDYEVS